MGGYPGKGQGCEVPVCTGAAGVQILDPFGLGWPDLLLTSRLKMRPVWPRLALRSLVRGGPAWPYFRLRWPRQEWPGVAKLLISAHFRSFPIIPLVDGGDGAGDARGSRRRGNDEGGCPCCEPRPASAFAGTTEGTFPTPQAESLRVWYDCQECVGAANF